MIDILSVLTVIALLAGSYTDFKKREVPDWISYSLIFSALGIRLISSLYFMDYTFILYGAEGLLAMFLLSNLFYYLKQWGGGDAKILMGLGAVIGLNIFDSSYLDFVFLFFLLIFLGAIYGIIFSVILAIKNKSKFIKSFKDNFNDLKILEIFALCFLIIGIFGLILINDYSLAFLIFGVSVIFFIGICSFVFVKSVEESCLLKKVKSSQLTEGDWVLDTIKINGKIIVCKKDLGITNEQIAKLKNYKKPILIKEGVPFIPVFFVSFIVYLWLKTYFFSVLQ